MTNGARPHRDSGTSAVEFALVVPLLVALVLGIIDYGLYFTDRLAVTQGVSQAARRAVVKEEPACPGASDLNCLAGEIKAQLGTVVSDSDVRVVVRNPKRWEIGATLRVCTSVTETGLTGLTPVPDSIRYKLDLLIEHTVPDNATSGETGTPIGGWGWC